jgi:small subunit ribosomal protein S4
MGEPRRQRKLREHPKKPYARLEEERGLLERHGLRRKRELRAVRFRLRRTKLQAKRLLAARASGALEHSPHLVREEREIIESLGRRSIILPRTQGVEDILGLSEEDLLNQRLSGIVLQRRFARTIREARQMIVHGHVLIGTRRCTVPSYTPMIDELPEISIQEGTVHHARWLRGQRQRSLEREEATKDSSKRRESTRDDLREASR